jgi:activator of 2-hydroxyglutaryl-CoA dehydratase
MIRKSGYRFSEKIMLQQKDRKIERDDDSKKSHSALVKDETLTQTSPPARAYRIGIDVGGTFTKAVLIDNATHEVVGRFSVLTTHADPRGVAKGVVEVFRNVLEQSGVDPKQVVFLAHSTTQATNALLEGWQASA